MNLKFLCASLAGVSSIGVAVAGGMYLSKSKNDEAKTDSTTKTVTQPSEAKGEAPSPTNTVAEQTRPNVAQNTGSSVSSGSKGAPSSGRSTTNQAPSGG